MHRWASWYLPVSPINSFNSRIPEISRFMLRYQSTRHFQSSLELHSHWSVAGYSWWLEHNHCSRMCIALLYLGHRIYKGKIMSDLAASGRRNIISTYASPCESPQGWPQRWYWAQMSKLPAPLICKFMQLAAALKSLEEVSATLEWEIIFMKRVDVYVLQWITGRAWTPFVNGGDYVGLVLEGPY